MKTPLLPLLLCVAGQAVCTAAETAPPATSAPFTWIDPADTSVAAIRETGEKEIGRVGTRLIFEVERSISTEGLIKTMEIAHLKDLTLPNPEPGRPRVTAIKRTSLQLRNPANAPDEADRAALERINAALQDGDDVPTLLIQHLTSAHAPDEWRVYRPISAMPLCLKCHGAPDTLQPEVRDYLRQRYPEDKATGYAAYQWRGVIRISLAAAEPVKPDVHH